ncbi:tail fiber protein [Prochlorococcus phage P-TIM68]|uniref:Peptidase S74 domain-containing protein n=1 Tax=Prochlorococcus phage P-TIM68 TaxID=1542477 RepID=A0A0K0KVF1_9CAUD|nr:tail fiber protein [Prochlorococcus phage P-TIM68]AIR93410.1 hypothetical protein [Prochlorococcus phage P-TIM68]
MPLGNPIRKQNESRIISVLATEGQSVFTVEGGYIINQISVFRNGVRLSNSEDFTAGDGSTVTLNDEANVDDRIEFHIFDRFTVQNAIIGAASTQTINGDLVLNGKLFGQLDVPSINLTGIITATELDLNGKGDISGDLKVTGISTFINVDATGIVTARQGLRINAGGLNVVGVTTTRGLSIFGNTTGLNVASGISTFTNVDATGIVTARQGLRINAGGLNVTAGISTFGGDIQAQGDVSIVDTIYHSGDTDTRIRFPSNDQIQFETNGANRLNIDSTGKIKQTAASGDTIFTLKRSNTNTTGSFGVLNFAASDDHSVANIQSLGDGDNEGAHIVFKTTTAAASDDVYNAATVERLRITSDGIIEVQDSVALGANAPQYRGKIRISGVSDATTAGGIEFHTSSGGGAGYGSRITADASGNMHFLTRSNNSAWSERARITSTGLFGIGTNAPDAKLYVNGVSSANVITARTADTNGNCIIDILSEGTTGNSRINFSDTAGTDGQVSYSHSARALIFATAGTTERLRIDSSGHMGLGVSPNTSWPSNGDFRALQIGTGACVFGRGSGDEDRGGIAVNFYHDGSARKYLANGHASIIDLNDGTFVFSTASSNSSGAGAAMSATQRLHIDNGGKLIMGSGTTTNDTSERFLVDGSASGDHCGLGIKTNNNVHDGYIAFHDSDATYRGKIVYDHEVDDMFIFCAGTERLRVDTIGQITSTSDNNGQVIHKFYNSADEGNASHTVEHHFNFNRTSGSMNLSGARIVAGKEREWIGSASNQDGFLAFYTCLNESPGEKMRIGSNNIFLHSTNSSGSNGRIYTNNAGANHATLEINQNSGSGTEMMAFRNGGTQIGSITQSGLSNTSYNTSSDYRLKENDVAISDGITRLKQLRPIRFNWKIDPSTTQDGFFAHEVSPVVPESVRGNKDEVFDTDGVGTQVVGGPKYQQIDHSKLVPLLTAALQEAITEIETLKTKVAALEGS